MCSHAKITRTFAACLRKSKVQQPQLIPSLAQHNITAGDVKVRNHAVGVKPAYSLHSHKRRQWEKCAEKLT